MQQLSISKHLNYRRASASLSNYRRARSSIPGASFRCSSLGPSVRPTVRPAAALLTALLVLPADRRESPTSRIAIASPSLRSGRTLNSVILALRLSPNRGSQVAYEQNLFCTAVRPPLSCSDTRICAPIRSDPISCDPFRSESIGRFPSHRITVRRNRSPATAGCASTGPCRRSRRDRY